ncbi:MAG: HEAT repeat domain-containing protein [Bryobacterales bacterium]|nr:HEAT repeat domain-containing protein [Bryobacterales bacterium]
MSQASAQTPAPVKPANPKPAPRPQPPPIPPEFQAGDIMKMGPADLVRLLRDPSASEFRKAKACMRAAMVGDKEAAAAMLPLLNDPQLNQYARYGLVPIPDPSVDDAFRAALGTLKGDLLVGVVDSIGQRKDAKAVDALAKLMYGTEPEVARAAIASLGRISGPAATDILLEGLGKTNGAVRSAVANACLVCAEEWLIKGDRKQATSLYERLTQNDIPKPVRLGAMNTIISLETAANRPR